MIYKLSVLTVFTFSYAGIIIFARKKSLFAGVGAMLVIILTGLLESGSPAGLFRFVLQSINWNVLGIFLGSLLIAEAFIASRVPALIAHTLVSRSNNVGAAILLICLMASFLSAFVENVATVLIVAPIALEISEKQRVSPVPFLIGIAISSNLQGTATLIGDPPSMILAGYMGLNFNQFFFLKGRPGIFFAVQVGAVASFIVLGRFFRKYRDPISEHERDEVSSWFPTGLIVLMIVLLALSSFFDPNFTSMGGIICMGLGLVAVGWFLTRKGFRKRDILLMVDADTLIFLSSIFLLVGGLLRAGLMDDIANVVLSSIGKNSFLIYLFIVLFSVAVSAFVDNVPYITAMIPVTRILAGRMLISPYLFVFGLLIGACLGGNITPIGASANVVSVSILRRNGREVGLREFARIGLPFTAAAVFVSSLFVWFVWR
jgi:Na+/H+ antiporter NhaD/arsenite permease-like protein